MPLLTFQVIWLGFEPRTHSLEGCCSIQLSYQTIKAVQNYAFILNFPNFN